MHTVDVFTATMKYILVHAAQDRGHTPQQTKAGGITCLLMKPVIYIIADLAMEILQLPWQLIVETNYPLIEALQPINAHGTIVALMKILQKR
jgi:hypothetical protein